MAFSGWVAAEFMMFILPGNGLREHTVADAVNQFQSRSRLSFSSASFATEPLLFRRRGKKIAYLLERRLVLGIHAGL